MPYEDQQGSSQVNQFAVQGYVTPLATNLAATTGGSDYSFQWQGGGTTAVPVNHVLVQNNTAANVQFELDTATTAGSPIIGPGQTLQFDIRVTVLHLLTAAAQNVNGNTGGNIVVRGWL